MKNKFKTIMIVILSVFIVFAQITSSILPVYAADKYDGVYEGVQSGPILLTSGTYLFKNVEVHGNDQQPSAVRIYGHVTIVLEGKNYVYGQDARWNGDTSSKSGAGFEVEANKNISLTLNGNSGVFLEAYGGNASKGQNGVSGGDGDGVTGGSGGAGGKGGNGASAAIGGIGGYYDVSNQFAKGQDSGDINLTGNFSLRAIGGNGAEGGRGGNGGRSNSSYKFLWCDVAAGGGGGGGGGGGWPAASIGGGGAAGSKGGNGTGGRARNPSTAAVNVEVQGGGGGGGGRGWGAGGGGGSGFFAFFQGRDKYSSIRPSGGAGGKSPWERGEGGKVGIMEATLAGSGNSVGEYALVIGSYSGDYPASDVSATRTDRDAMGANDGRRYGQFASQGAMEYNGVDTAWAFYIQGTNMREETPEASKHSGDGVGRRYELFLFAGGAGGLGEESLRGKAQYNLKKADGIKLDAQGLVSYGDGGGTDGYGVSRPITQVIDLADPDTKITFSPAKGNYTGDAITPTPTITSKSGTKVDASAFTMTLVDGTDNGLGERIYGFSGKGDDYPAQKVINYTEREYVVDKGYRKDVLCSDKYMINQGASINLYLENHKFDNCTVTWEITTDEGMIIETAEQGTTNSIKTLVGTGNIKAKAHISEGEYYFAYTTKEITISVVPPGADLFVIQKLENQIYNGKEHTPPFEVYYGGRLLEKDKDYKVSYSNNINVGEARVTIEGKNDFRGSVEAWFSIQTAEIQPIRFENATYISVPPRLPDLYYSSSSQMSVPINGIWNGIAVTEGVNYLVNYSETINVGEVIVTIIGIGNFAGTTTLKYNILPSDIGTIENLLVIPPEDTIYDGTAKESKPKVTLRGLELTEGQDYTLSYENNIDAGTATVYVYGKGNFKSDSFIKETFTIKPKTLYIVPEENQNKYTGEYDPTPLDYRLEGIVEGDDVQINKNSKLSRVPGEDIGRYRILQGNMALESGVKDNANYDLQISSNAVNFEIKLYDIRAEATLEGTYNEETGWYTSITKVVAPEGYLISRSNDIEPEGTPAEASSWKAYIEADDGDYSTGFTYYLKEIPKTSGGVSYVSQAKSVVFKQDHTVSSVEINMNDKKIYTQLMDTISFKTFFNTHCPVEITTSDETSGLKQVDYYFADAQLSKEELALLPKASWKPADLKMYTMDLSTEMRKIIYVRVIDVAGNINYVNTDGFTIDKTNPLVDIQYDDSGVWVAKNADVIVKASDILAGIKDRNLDYHYRYVQDGRETDINLLKLDDEDKTVITQLPDGEYDLIVSARDNADNYYESSVLVKKDSIDPIVELNGNLTHYATYKDIDITAKVGASGVDKVYVQRQNYGDAVDEMGSWIDITVDYNNGHKYRVDKNGTYYVKYINHAGVSSNTASISFDTIDTLTPIVNVIGKSDGSLIPSDTWSGSNVDVQFNNTEVKNLGKTTFAYRTKDKNDPLGEWSNWNSIEKGNDYVANATIGQSGETIVEVKITSAAGLSATATYIVKIDKQNPEASVILDTTTWTKLQENVKFNSFYNTTKKFQIIGKDKLSGIGKIEYFIAKEKISETVTTEQDLEEYVTTHGGWLSKPSTLNGIEVEVSPNETYVIYGKVADKMGNYTYVSSDGVVLDNQAPNLLIYSDSFVEVPNKGKWLLNENDFLTVDVSDHLSGPDYINYYEDASVNAERIEINNGSASISKLSEGIHSLKVTAFDKAGNNKTETITVQKDSVSPEVNLVGDTFNFSEEVHVDITPLVGYNGIKKLELKYVALNQNENDVSFTDIQSSYGFGYDVIKNGTLIVRIEDNLGRINESRVIFNNIQSIEPDIKCDIVNDDGAIVNSDNWYSAVDIRFYNNPRNVANFKYEYKIDDGLWIPTDPVDGYAYVEALEGEHTYFVRVTNNKTLDFKETKVFAKVDNTKPEGMLELDKDQTQWTGISSNNGFTKGLTEETSVTLKNVKDTNLSSGIHSVEYYVLSAGENERVMDFPKSEQEIKNQIAGKWLSLNMEEVNDLIAGGEFKICDAIIDHEYMVFVKIRDYSGNVTYLSSEGITIDATKPIIHTNYEVGTWIHDDTQAIQVTIKDNLSGVMDGFYTIKTGLPSTTKYPYTILDRNDLFEIIGTNIPEGVSVLGIDAVDISGNQADYVQVEIWKDTQKPVIKASENADLALRDIPYVDLETIVGVSGVQSVTVQRMGELITKDITETYSGGYQPKRNGTYTFIVTNKAGVSSDPVQITFNNIGTPPELIVTATKGLDGIYQQGTWSDSNVYLNLSTKDIIVGNCKYEYSLDQGVTWKSVNASQNGYVIEISESGTFPYLLKVSTPKGAESDIVEFLVNTDFEKPEFDYIMTPEDNTSLYTDLTILPKDKDKEYSYSFDEGLTFQTEATKRFTSNGNIKVVVRNKAGAIATKTIKIDNIDRLSPYMTIYKNSVMDNHTYSIMLEANDATSNLDFTETGVDNVFITNKNPYSEISVRTLPLEEDYIMQKNQDGQYSTTNTMKAESDGNLLDNYWIIVTDKVGNYSIRSFRVLPGNSSPEEPDKPTPEEPGKPNPTPEEPDKPLIDNPTPETPGNSSNNGDNNPSDSNGSNKPIDVPVINNPDIIDIENTLKDVGNIDKVIGTDVSQDIILLNKREKAISDLISTILGNKNLSLSEEKDYLETLLKMDLTQEQKLQIEARLQLIQNQEVHKVWLWILSLFLFILGCIYLYRQKKTEKDIEMYEEID